MTSGTTLNAPTFPLPGSWKEKRGRGPEKIFEEILAENVLNMGREIVNQAHEEQRIFGRINKKRNTLRHIVFKLTKIKDKDKTSTEKWPITYNGSAIRLSPDFSTETLQASRNEHDTFKLMKGKKTKTKYTLPSKTPIWWRNEKR